MALAAFDIVIFVGCAGGFVVGAHGDSGFYGDGAGIEDQGQIGVAEHGCAGVEADVFEHGGERLDDDLFRVGEPIDDEAEAAAIGIEHGDEVVALGGGLVLAAGHQQAVKKDQRQELAAQPVERRALDPFDGCGGLLGRNVNKFRERALGQGEALVDAAHDERGNDGQGERNAQAERGSLAGAGVDLDFAADFFHVGADHVHADAASADIGDRSGGGEAGQEDELQQLALASCAARSAVMSAALDGLAGAPFRQRCRRRRRRLR